MAKERSINPPGTGKGRRGTAFGTGKFSKSSINIGLGTVGRLYRGEATPTFSPDLMLLLFLLPPNFRRGLFIDCLVVPALKLGVQIPLRTTPKTKLRPGELHHFAVRCTTLH
jgi:hypothetical protein